MIHVSEVSWGTFVLDGGAMFGIVPRAIWQKLLAPDESNGIRLASRSLVVRGEGRAVLVDCGMWSYFPEKLRDQVYGLRQDDVRETLKRSCGVAAGEVTDIIATHLHFDHLGGAVTREGEGCVQTFPNALIHVQRAQLEWARGPSIKDRGSFVPEMVAALEGSGQLQVHEGDWELCQGVGVRVVSGHTPGMQLVTVRDGERTLIHAADLVPTSFHVPVPYIMAYDLNPLATAREKGEWYAANPEAIWFFQHDPEWPWWTVRRNEKGGYGRGERVGP